MLAGGDGSGSAPRPNGARPTRSAGRRRGSRKEAAARAQGGPGQRQPPRHPGGAAPDRVRHPLQPRPGRLGRQRRRPPSQSRSTCCGQLRASPTSAAGSGAISGSSATRIGSRSGPRRAVSPTWRSVPTGQTLAGLERKGRIQLWDRHTGESRRTTGVTTQGRRADLAGGVGALAFSPDGRSLAGPGPDASLMLYAVDTGLPTLSFEGPPEAVLKLAWSPDGRTLVAALARHRMRVWDARDGHLIHESFGGHDGPVAAVAFSPDGRTIASASYDRTVKLWRPRGPESTRSPSSRGTPTRSAPWPSAPTAGGSPPPGLDRTLRIWDAQSGAALAVIRGHTGSVTSLAYVPDSARVVTGSADETVRVWDTASGQELRTFKGHTDEVGAVAVSPDGHDIASASARRDGAGLGRRQPAPPPHAPEPLRADLRRGRGMPGV